MEKVVLTALKSQLDEFNRWVVNAGEHSWPEIFKAAQTFFDMQDGLWNFDMETAPKSNMLQVAYYDHNDYFKVTPAWFIEHLGYWEGVRFRNLRPTFVKLNKPIAWQYMAQRPVGENPDETCHN